jgi:hypothetical protein
MAKPSIVENAENVSTAADDFVAELPAAQPLAVRETRRYRFHAARFLAVVAAIPRPRRARWRQRTTRCAAIGATRNSQSPNSKTPRRRMSSATSLSRRGLHHRSNGRGSVSGLLAD